MAVPSGTYQTFQQVGIREDLSDTIYDISPTETPCLTAFGRGKATSTKHEWQTDALAAASGTNKVIEGDDFSADTASATTRLYNYTQISDKGVIVSDTADRVSTAGRKKELSYQIAKRSKELKRDMETTITGNYAYNAGAAGTARASAGIEAWLTNSSRGSTTGSTPAADPTGDGSDTATDGDVLQAFTEADLKNVIKQCWSAGGDPDMIVVGPVNKQTASGFSGIATQYRENSGTKQAKILGAADVYISDFGEHKIVPNRFSRDRSALVLDSQYWEVAYLEPFNVKKIARTGHGEKRLLKVEYTLCAKSPTSSGVVSDLTTS